MSGQVWWPALESNQGTLSLIAIALALFFWISDKIEHNRRERREIEDALELFNEAVDTLIKVGEADAEEDEEGLLEDLALQANALRVLASAHMKRPLLALACLRGAQVLEEGLEQGVFEQDSDEVEALHGKLTDQRDKAANAVNEARRRKVRRAKTERTLDRILKRMIRERGKPSVVSGE